MKKVLIAVICCVLLVCLVSCNGIGFMSDPQVKRVVAEFGTPQAEMTLEFKSSNKNMKYIITYDLLLDKTPITTINFINLVDSGFYTNTIMDSYTTSYNYYIAGRYVYNKEATDEKIKDNESGKTFIGEFKSNNYGEPNGGYAQFSMFSLAMYHDSKGDAFNDGNGTLIFSTSDSVTLNSNNYAVFAKMNKIQIYQDDNLLSTYTDGKINGMYLDLMTKLTGRPTMKVVNSANETRNEQILGSGTTPYFVFSIKMLGDKDWSKLPKVG